MKNKLLSLKVVFSHTLFAGATIFGVQAASAQDLYYIEHKPSSQRLVSCAESDGEFVTAGPNSSSWLCAQWERVSIDGHFQLRNEFADRVMFPGNEFAGSWIKMQPKAWTGNWSQWSFDSTGDGYGYIVNRGTGYILYHSGSVNQEIAQQPSAWSGDFTRFRFVSVDGGATPAPTPTPTDIPTIAPTDAPTATPEPIDGATPGSTVVEAESGALSGIAETYNDGAASGGQGVAFLSEVGSSVAFSNVQPADKLTVRYAAETGGGQISVRVNSADAGDISFSPTGAWTGTYNAVSADIQIPMNATVEIFFDTGDAAMNIDTVEFILGGAAPPSPTPTATPTPCSGDCSSTPAPTPAPTSPPVCGAPEVDPAADLGEGYVVGITTDGVFYHRAIAGHSPQFAQLNVLSVGDNAGLPDVGPVEFQEQHLSNLLYRRYENKIDNVDANTTYNVEVRLQGSQFDSGQCTPQWQFKPGEGATESACFVVSSDNPGTPAAPRSSVDMVVTNANANKARLTGGSGSDKPEYALYTTSQTCTGACLDTWPMLTVVNPENLIGAGGVTGDFGTEAVVISSEDECGETVETTYHQVTYNGEKLYFYAGDATESTTAGENISGWDLAEADLIPQLPLISNPMPALQTPGLGKQPGSHGFTFDLDGTSIVVRGGNMFQVVVHNTRYVDGVGDVLVSVGDNDFQMWCSNNQIQWHKGDLDPVAFGQFEGVVPGSCYGDYYYFFRFEKRGPVNNDPGSRWTYSGLFTTAGERIDPGSRPTKTYRTANWFRFRHPHAHDGNTEAIFDSQNNSSLLAGLARFESSVSDGPSGVNLTPGVGPIRIEALETGVIPNFVPTYAYNTGTCCGNAFDYGNVISYEITAVTGGIDSQTYNTHQHIVVGQGYDSPLGDPRLTLAGAASTNMVFSDAGSHIALEKNAVFTQHVTTLTSASDVDNFLRGHHLFHGVDPNAQGTTALHTVLIGNDTCGNCHFRDGRGSEVVQTSKGPRVPPPVYGVGLLQHISTGGSSKLSWDGSVATVEQQVANALRDDHGVSASSLGGDLTLIEDYTRFLSVPNREPGKIDQAGVAEGQVLFHEIGCADCHTENQKTSSSAPAWAANLTISPFSDMRNHDVGTGGSFRTPPLWGLGTNIDLLTRNGRALLLMHDGRATSVEAAITAHGGEASAVIGRYNGLSADQKAAIVAFLKSL